jgi:hypothetical protein
MTSVAAGAPDAHGDRARTIDRELQREPARALLEEYFTAARGRDLDHRAAALRAEVHESSSSTVIRNDPPGHPGPR